MNKFFGASLFTLSLLALSDAFSVKFNIAENANNISHPVILIPGIEGSMLYAKLNRSSSLFYCYKRTSDYFNLWLNPLEFLPEVVKCFNDNMRLIYDNVTHTTSNQEGVDIIVPDFGGIDAIDYLSEYQLSIFSYFHNMITYFESHGYVRNVSLRGAPYDFRRAPNEQQEYFENLKVLIEKTFALNGQKSCALVCHSMGCLFTLYFLNSQTKNWKKQYINSMITIGAPWGGATMALQASTIGYNLGVWILKDENFKNMERTFPSTAFLLPSPFVFGRDKPLVVTPLKRYYATDYPQLFTDINDTISLMMWNDTKSLLKLNHPGVDLFCIHGTGLQTIEMLKYDSMNSFPGKPKIINGNGDATVNEISLRECLRWSNRTPYNFTYKVVPNGDHVDMVKDDAIIQSIYKYITS